MLHCILDGTRSFVPELLPEMWKEAIRPGRSGHLESPTHPETEAAFRRLSQMPVKICLFIDGLDEHLGNQQEGISFIQSMIRSGNTKVLASSRPEPNFVAAFSSGPMLRMQDLTKGYQVVSYVILDIAANLECPTHQNPIINSEVVFMHRTVAEFLDDTAPWNLDELDFSDRTFHPSISLPCLWMYAAQFVDPESPYFGPSISNSLHHASQAAGDGDFALISVLLEFRNIFREFGWSETGCRSMLAPINTARH